ncbi:hypothetical protein BDV97DRAFT_406524 [Delphinella strobiligena]|nr:hypothetical protein BDV97DRAFT_406524 [Delphinella strobiligena]
MSYRGGPQGYSDSPQPQSGGKRKKLAGYLKAANELRQSYTSTWNARDGSADNHDDDMPGAFPDAAVVRGGDEEMVLFPGYARRHIKSKPPTAQPGTIQQVGGTGRDSRDTIGAGDAEFWKQQWEKHENDKAIVDVDVRGWIYNPHKGPMSRKHRLMVGLARQLVGLPAPSAMSSPSESRPGSRAASPTRDTSSRRDEEIVAQQADEIVRRGEKEAAIAGQGGFSERPSRDTDGRSTYSARSRNSSPNPSSADHLEVFPTNSDSDSISPVQKRLSWTAPSKMSAGELSVANNHLMARLKPFMANPMANIPISAFFYNDHVSRQRTVYTDASGHFHLRAPLEFVPTHVRVLASENLSATEEVRITSPQGVSLISDIDDTVKHSAIGSGAREIFRNAFIRDLGDLTIDGVQQWYTKLADMGVKVHYVSNSPWQLYPVLTSFLKLAGLPRGSYHLKQYSGMLQGIFEPVAERKKATMERIMRDFPERKFILVGDSGEADLEVYTDTALEYPGRVLGIFIRDVTSPPKRGFFDPSLGPLSGSEMRPQLPPRLTTEPPAPRTSAVEENLIDFSDDESPASTSPTAARTLQAGPRTALARTQTDVPMRKASPTIPAKPSQFRVPSGEIPTVSVGAGVAKQPPPKPRKPSTTVNTNVPSPLSQISPIVANRPPLPERRSYAQSAKKKLNAAYNVLPAAPSYLGGSAGKTANHSEDASYAMGPRTMTSATTRSMDELKPQGRPGPPQPPRRNLSSYPYAAASYASNRIGSSWGSENNTNSNNSGSEGTGGPYQTPVNKKEEMWKRRWARAKELMDRKGVVLRAWRVGSDVDDVCIALVRQALNGIDEHSRDELERIGHDSGSRSRGSSG